ncbi:MAG: FAD-binding oxidoreductase [Litorimonas sp.]
MVSVLHANDALGHYPPTYYAATAKALDLFEPVTGEVSCDVAIVGAGLSGLSAALQLSKRGHNVALLDAHRVGWGASGRNGGQISGDQRLEQKELEKLVGKEDARKLWKVAQDSLAYIHTLAREHNIDYEFQPGIIHADHKKRLVPHSQAYVDFMKENYGCEHLSFLNQSQMRELVGSKAYYGGSIDSQAGSIHPLKFAFGLARACRENGVRIFEKSEVLDITKGTKPVLKTANGSVTCSHLILACNGYLGTLDKPTAKRVMPINNYIIATEPLSEDAANDLIRNNAAVADSKFVINYFRLSKDRRLLFGGRESYRYRFPKDIKSFVRTAMLSIYPQLEDTKIDYGWGGTLSITMSRMPYIKRMGGNVMTISGYSGHGVAMSTFAGKMAADAIDGTASAFDVMARIPDQKIPGGLALRVPLLSLAMFYYSLRDKI